ncbi:MAG: ABC transporter permease [Betaproteobacteria bacterium]
MTSFLTLASLTDFLAVTVRSATPTLLTALGILIMARSGLVNIGGEGLMLIGTLVGVAGSLYAGSAWAGLLAAAVAAGLAGLVFAYVTVTLRANQMVAGTALNLLGLGLTSSLARILFGVNTAPPQIASFKSWAVPGLASLPVVGQAFFSQMPPVYLAVLLVPLIHTLLYRTPAGLALRAVGEHPRAADAVGVDVFRVRYTATVLGAMLAGAGGAYLSLGLLSFFGENMVAGRGFMALAAVIFGKYTPAGTLAATLLFGAGEALEFRLQASGTAIPQEFLLMVPYVLTILALAGFVGRSLPPAALGQPYAKE